MKAAILGRVVIVLTTGALIGGRTESAVGAAAGSSYRLVAFTGQPAPGGGSYGMMNVPRLGADGSVAFTSFLPGTSSLGIYAGRPGRLRGVSLAEPFHDVFSLSISKAGVSAFGGYRVDSQTEAFTDGVFVVASGRPQLALPLSRSTIQISFRPGYLAVKAPAGALGGGFPAQGALLIGPAGKPEIAMSEGDAAPGFPAGAVIHDILGDTKFGSVDLGEGGDAVLQVSVAPSPNRTPAPISAIYAGKKGGWKLVAAEGGSVPDVSDATYAQLSSSPSIASNALVAFVGTFSSGESRSEAAFAGPPGQVRLMVRDGDIVPATADVSFASIGQAVVNAGGDVAFTASIRYPNGGMRSGIWLKRRASDPVLIAIDGITLDTPSGRQEVTQVDLAGPGSFNDLNQLVFRATFANGAGIYLADTRPLAPWVRPIFPRRPADRVTRDKFIVISGEAIDDTGVARVEYTVAVQDKTTAATRANFKPAPKLARGDRRWSFKVPLRLGINRISVTATDKLGNGSEPLILTIRRYEPAGETTRRFPPIEIRSRARRGFPAPGGG